MNYNHHRNKCDNIFGLYFPFDLRHSFKSAARLVGTPECRVKYRRRRLESPWFLDLNDLSLVESLNC